MYVNLSFIEGFPDLDLAKEKSREILKLLLAIAPKLQGKKKFRKNNQYVSELLKSHVLFSMQSYIWIYDKDLRVNKPSDLSSFDLNSGLYRGISADKEAYKILGFVFPDIIHHYQVLTVGENNAIYLIASPFAIGKFADIMQSMAPEYPVIKAERVESEVYRAINAILGTEQSDITVVQAYIQIVLARCIGKMNLVEKFK